jgi:pimeloyl-ACP methyl ester carboxylesterase
MPTVDVRDARLAYDLLGSSGDPTALIHGSWVDRHIWDRVAPGLSGSLQVLAYDRRGHGESRGEPRSHPVREDAADLAGLLEAIDLYPVHLVGHSYGAAVAVRLAADRPELVRSLALHEPPFLTLLESEPEHRALARSSLQEIRALQQAVRDGRPETAAEQFVERFALESGGWGRLAPEVRAAFVRQAGRWVEELDDPDALGPDPELVRGITVPVLLTAGSRSPVVLREIVAAVERLLPNATLTILPDVGHAPQLTDPDQFAGVLGMFLLERNVPST